MFATPLILRKHGMGCIIYMNCCQYNRRVSYQASPIPNGKNKNKFSLVTR